MDKRYVRPDGSITWVLNSVAALRNGEGKITGAFAASVDVTDRKRVEKALSQSEERLQKVLSIETVGVIYFDLEGGIHDANVAFQRMSGYAREDFQRGRVRWDVITPPEFMEATLKSREEFLSKGQNTPYEKQYIRADGSRFWGLFAGKRLSETECVEFVVDITEGKEAEALLEQRVKERTEELEMRNRELEQFTYVSSHDLQEPLRKIVMFADMVKSDSYNRLTEASQMRLDRVIDDAWRMTTVLRDVLDFASLNKEENLQVVDLEEVLASVYSDLELMIQEKGAKITADPLPVVSAIPTQMHQLFYNLINNALKFSKPAEPPHIHITLKKLDDLEAGRHPELNQGKPYYQIRVRDNGIGFHANVAEKIFGMFQRLHNKEAYEGTGIGLAQGKKVVSNHRGKIWAESHPGKGASFKMIPPAE